MITKKALSLTLVSALIFSACEAYQPNKPANKNTSNAPFGTESDVSYAKNLWDQMVKNKLVGKSSIKSTPYTGTHPHGAILDTIETTMTMSGHTGDVIVKKNFGGEGVSKEAVANEPDKWLKAVTVMYRREKGYDTENKDWFWVKYAPDGSVMTNPAGMSLAGRVAKGKGEGCIACHGAAPGGDMVFNHNRLQAH